MAGKDGSHERKDIGGEWGIVQHSRANITFQQLKDSFSSKGLNVQDLVVLSGIVPAKPN